MPAPPKVPPKDFPPNTSIVATSLIRAHVASPGSGVRVAALKNSGAVGKNASFLMATTTSAEKRSVLVEVSPMEPLQSPNTPHPHAGVGANVTDSPHPHDPEDVDNDEGAVEEDGNERYDVHSVNETFAESISLVLKLNYVLRTPAPAPTAATRAKEEFQRIRRDRKGSDPMSVDDMCTMVEYLTQNLKHEISQDLKASMGAPILDAVGAGLTCSRAAMFAARADSAAVARDVVNCSAQTLSVLNKEVHARDNDLVDIRKVFGENRKAINNINRDLRFPELAPDVGVRNPDLTHPSTREHSIEAVNFNKRLRQTIIAFVEADGSIGQGDKNGLPVPAPDVLIMSRASSSKSVPRSAGTESLMSFPSDCTVGSGTEPGKKGAKENVREKRN